MVALADCGIETSGALLDCDPESPEDVCAAGCLQSVPCEARAALVNDGFYTPDLLSCWSACTSFPYLCRSGAVIPAALVCDGWEDCPDRSDEIQCDWPCPGTEGTLPRQLVCDGQPHCSEGADESECSWFCEDDTRAITVGFVCDGQGDCPDMSDELAGCDWLCSDAEPIIRAWVCDGIGDCNDGSDEADSLCNYACGNGLDRTTSDWVCDGIRDCPEGSDEIFGVDGAPCPGQWQCGESGAIIPEQWRCDTIVDCPDGWEDEADCEWQCFDGSWILSVTVGDGWADCPDHSDEAVCPGGSAVAEPTPDPVTEPWPEPRPRLSRGPPPREQTWPIWRGGEHLWRAE